jgi:indole-3-glycerol phosphate synthase
MTILDHIIDDTKQAIFKKTLSKKQRRDTVLSSLRNHPFFIFGEIKPKSPSAGILREKINVSSVVQEFVGIGCRGISVLTNYKYFGGSINLLRKVQKYTELPVLRKDFIVDITQIMETYTIDADIILLIVKILNKNKLAYFIQTAIELMLIPLIEVHTEKELEIALNIVHDLKAEEHVIISVNNRNLDTFVTDVHISLDMKKYIPSTILSMSLSGILNKDHLQSLQSVGYNGVLIGQGLVKDSSFV